MRQRVRGARRQWSITLRLAVLYSLSTFIVLLLVGIGSYWVLARSLERDEGAALAREVAELESLLRNPEGNRPLIAMEINPVSGDHGPIGTPVTYFRILDVGAAVLFETAGMQHRLPSEAFPEESAAPVHERATRRDGTDGLPYLLVSATAPLPAAGDAVVIQAAMDLSTDEALLANYRRSMAALLLLAMALSSAISIVVARHATQPLQEIATTVRRVGAEQLHERIEPARWPRELRELAGAFDEMLKRLEVSFMQLKWFSADVAHELRTPVNVLMGEAEVALSKQRTEDEYRQVLESALEEYQRLARLIDNLLFLARAENAQTTIERVSLDAHHELAAVAAFFEAAAHEQGVNVALEGEARLDADPTLLRRAVSNLLANALHHTPRDGRIVLAATRVADGGVEIAVSDTGSGINPGEIERVFDRFYRGNNGSRQPRGSGIGLAIVKSIMALHVGTVTLESEPDAGTTVRLRFPPGEESPSTG